MVRYVCCLNRGHYCKKGVDRRDALGEVSGGDHNSTGLMNISIQHLSLRQRILGSLFLVFTLTLAGALFGLWTYQQDKLVTMTSRRAMQAGFTVEAGLRTAMLANDRQAVRSIMAEMLKVANLSEISILDPKGRVVISSKRAKEGQVINRAKEPTCLVCHKDTSRPRPGEAAMFVEEGRHFLRSVVKIENRPPCFRCHSAQNAICGILIVDSSLDETFSLIKTVAWRSLLTGLVSFCLVIFLISLIINRFVSRPVKALMEGIKHVEDGDFTHWVEVRGGGEFGEMGDSFNVMSRAIVRYIDEIKAKNNEIASLYTLVQRISETIDLKKLKVIVVNLLVEILDADNIVLALPIDDKEGRFELVWKSRGEKHYASEYFISSEIPPHRDLSKEELVGWMDGSYSEARYLDHNTRVLVPLQHKEVRFGLLAVSRKKDNIFTHADKSLLPALAHHVEIAFTNAWLYNMAITDELTSLFTKRHFQTKIASLEENYRLTGEGFAVMMIDLDRFKQVNDTYGHVIGDRMLADLAVLIRSNLRMGEIPCRYGGDEFVVLLPINDITTVRMVAERVHKSISEHWFDYEGLDRVRMTVSVGVACCPQHASSANELVMVADSSMYRAKESGRDRVHIADSSRERE